MQLFKQILVIQMVVLLAQSNNAYAGNTTTTTTIASPVDYGVLGEVFEIQEQDLIEVILQKLHKLQAEGKLEAYQHQIQAKVQDSIERPQPVKDIIHTQTPRSYTFDPSITVSQDLKDHQGNVFYKKGTVVNPLTIRSMTKPLLLVDGDSTDHLTWAFKMLKIHPSAKIILVKGAPLKIMKEIGLTIYFDQQGVICKRFGVKQVPVLITQKDDQLLIQEIKTEDVFELETSQAEHTRQGQNK